MNSLEDLEDLFNILCEREHTNSEHSFWLKLYNNIKKDLEAFIIFKKYFRIYELREGIALGFKSKATSFTKLNNRDSMIIEEALKNGNK